MKKLFTVFTIAGMLSFIACGPSAEEKAAMEKAKQDSIATVEKARQDSLDAAAEATRIMEEARQDSIEAAEKVKQDSIEAASKKKGTSKPKTKEEKKIEGVKKTTGGRG